jgi:hypothetical protein
VSDSVKLNGTTVERHGDTIFIRLPPEAWVEIDGCACDTCKDDFGIPRSERKMTPTAFWDTLAVAEKKPADGRDHTWTVHHPDLYTAAERKAERERRKKLAENVQNPGLLVTEINDKYDVICAGAERWNYGQGEVRRHIWQALNHVAETARKSSDNLPVSRTGSTQP